MHLSIVTPEKKVFDEDISSLTVNTPSGQITILPNHVNLVTKIEPGEMILRIDGKEQSMAITGGFLEFTNENISILADYAVRAEHIEVEKAIEAQKRAEAAIKKARESASERDMAIASAELRKSLLELKVAKRRRRI